MKPFFSNPKAAASLLRRRVGVAPLSSCRVLHTIARVRPLPLHNPIRALNEFEHRPFTLCGNSIVQRRQFLSCGDREEDGVLSKVYEERRVMGYSQEQMFDVVAAVDLYDGFVPWCQRSEILRRHPDGSFDAQLAIGFKFLEESYVSHVEFKRPISIKTTATQSNLFDHLINTWEFKPGPVPGSCSLYFLVDFKFQSPLYRQVASMFFKEVVARLIGSFSERCRMIYGPGVQVEEEPYAQRR